MELEFGSFLTPSAGSPDDVVALAHLKEIPAADGLDEVRRRGIGWPSSPLSSTSAS